MNKVTIDSIAFIADGNYSSKYPRADEFKMEGVPFIRANNFFNSTISDDDMLFISKEKHSELKKGHLEADDVLITTRGNIGKTVLVPKKHAGSNINAQIVLLRCKNTILPKYLLHVFKIPFVENQLMNFTTGTALKQLPVGNLRKIQIPLPPLSTQKAIAEKLDKADALRKKDKELLAQYDELAQAVFIDVFGDPVNNERGWEVKKVNDITLPIKNLGRATEPDIIQYVDISSVDNIRKRIVNSTSYKIDERPSRAQQVLKNSDILLSTVRPNLKNIAINTNEDFIGSTGFYVFRCKEIINHHFLFEFLNSDSVTSELESMVSGANYPALKSSDIKFFDVIIPPIDLQNQFAEKIQNIEAQKAIVRLQSSV